MNSANTNGDLMKTKTQLKQAAQDAILHYSQNAFYPTADDLGMTEKEREVYMEQITQQRARVAKLFGVTL